MKTHQIIKWYQDYDGTFDYGFACTILVLVLLVGFIFFIFGHAALVTEQACEARGLKTFAMRGYFCVDSEGRLYKP